MRDSESRTPKETKSSEPSVKNWSCPFLCGPRPQNVLLVFLGYSPTTINVTCVTLQLWIPSNSPLKHTTCHIISSERTNDHPPLVEFEEVFVVSVIKTSTSFLRFLSSDRAARPDLVPDLLES